MLSFDLQKLFALHSVTFNCEYGDFSVLMRTIYYSKGAAPLLEDYLSSVVEIYSK